MYKKTRRNLKDLDRGQRKAALDAMHNLSRLEIMNRIVELNNEREAMEVALDCMRKPKSGKEATPKFIVAEDWTLEELRGQFMLNARGYNRMKEHGLKSFKEILELGWDGLLEIPGVGWSTRRYCADKIKEKTGIVLRGYPYD